MADEELENESGVPEPESGGGKLKMLLFGGIGLVLLGIGIVTGPMIMNMVSPPEAEGDEAEVEEVVEPKSPAIYQSLHPPLVVNFKDSTGDAHFMQITMEVMSREQNVINAIREHTPVIRNNLILLFSGVIYEEVTTREGKEQMLADGLAEIRKVMADITEANRIEAVYFTSLVIQ